MMQKTIFFDESGQTGTHLLDKEQPHFSVGSTDIEEQEAAEIITRCFSRKQGGELKSSKLLKQPQGRKGYLAFAQEVAKQPHRYFASKIEKRFTVVAKMVDHLVEPTVHASGYDFYRDDYARRYANMAAFAFDHILSREKADGILEAFNTFARQPTRSHIKAVRRRLEEALQGAPEGADMFLQMMLDGAWRFDRKEIDTFVDGNDIHLTSVLSSMGHWQTHHSGPFRVVHDESNHFFQRNTRWSIMTDPKNTPEVINVGEKTIILPIPVTQTISAKSHECAPLQLCDLIAGFVSRASKQGDPDFKAFAKDVVDAGIGEIGLHPVSAGDEFIEGPPSPLDGPDAIDRIRLNVNARM